jgi:hypothetical protein
MISIFLETLLITLVILKTFREVQEWLYPILKQRWWERQLEKDAKFRKAFYEGVGNASRAVTKQYPPERQREVMLELYPPEFHRRMLDAWYFNSIEFDYVPGDRYFNLFMRRKLWWEGKEE